VQRRTFEIIARKLFLQRLELATQLPIVSQVLEIERLAGEFFV
jgi:hypothetical protein